MSRMLDDLYLPDGKRLTSQIVGKPGSGKSYYLTHTIDTFLKKHKDPSYRLIYICPKQEADLGEKNTPIGVDKLEKRLKKNRVAVVYPNPHYVDAEVDYCIDLVFSIQQANPDFSCTIIIDDAQTFISSRKAASPSFRRLALTGRSKNIRFVAVAHQMVEGRIVGVPAHPPVGTAATSLVDLARVAQVQIAPEQLTLTRQLSRSVRGIATVAAPVAGSRFRAIKAVATPPPRRRHSRDVAASG